MAVGGVPPLPSVESDVITLGSVARLDEQKDPLRFLRVIRHLADTGLRVRGSWVGSGDLERAMHSAVAELRLEGVVDVLPATQRPEVAIASFDVLLMTSRWEGLPLSVIEAMSLGRGIVAPRVGGLPELVSQDVNGWLFEHSADDSVIAGSLAAMLAEGRHHAWGVASRAAFLDRGTEADMVDQLLPVYSAALRSARD
jgi:glycosyltransferase involved in cell wall biosynthesis